MIEKMHSVYNYSGGTLQELLNQFYNEIEQSNSKSETALQFTEWLKEQGLKGETEKLLKVWLHDGTLENLIDITKLNKINEQLEQNTYKETMLSRSLSNLTNFNLLKNKANIKDIIITNSNSKHNAFTSYIKFNETYVIAYRVAETHTSFDGKMAIKTSTDNEVWSDETFILENEGEDFRDPQFIIFDNKLVLRYVKRINGDLRNVYTTYTSDLINWSEPVELPNPLGISSASRGNMTIKTMSYTL